MLLAAIVVRRLALRACALVTFGFAAAVVGAQTPPSETEFAAQARALVDKAQPPGGAALIVVVTRGDTRLLQHVAGYADHEQKVSVTLEHEWPIASVSKQFTAALVMRLVDQGRLTLDDSLSKYLPDFPGGGAVTIRHLLNHTSGLGSYTEVPGYFKTHGTKDTDLPALIASFKDLRSNFEPGTLWRYNNSGYVLLAAVVEKVMGKTWESAVTELSSVAGLTHTGYGHQRVSRSQRVQGHSWEAANNTAVAAMSISLSQAHAAGGLVSTPTDLLRWNQALHRGRLLSAASYQQMTTPLGAAKTPRQGFGVVVEEVQSSPLIHHSGGMPGFSTHLAYAPAADVSVVVLRAMDASLRSLTSASTLARQLATLAAGKPLESETSPTASGAVAAVSDADLQRWVGQFVLVSTQRKAEFFVQDGTLHMRRGARVDALVPLSARVMRLQEGAATLTLTEDGKRIAAKRGDGSDAGELQRLDP